MPLMTTAHINNYPALFEKDPELRNKLLPFQRQGVRQAARWNWRILIADVMGLGKTMQALACLRLVPEARPAVVVCKAVGKPNWFRHAMNWLKHEDIFVVDGNPTPENIYKMFMADIVIINYDILANEEYTKTIVEVTKKGKMKEKEEAVERNGSGWINFLQFKEPEMIIIDEGQFIKNKKAQRTRAVLDLCTQVPHIIVLGGTGGLKSRPRDGFTIYNLLRPDIFPDEWSFWHRYCGAKKKKIGSYYDHELKKRIDRTAWDFDGASNMEELHDKLTTHLMIRRTKQDVYDELPVKTRDIIPLAYDSKEYDRVMKEFDKWLLSRDNNDGAAMFEIEKMKQAAAHGKLKNVLEWIEDFLEEEEGKLIVFATHIDIVNKIHHHFADIAVKVNGQVTPTAKQAAIDAFQTDKRVRLFVANGASAGDTIDLTAASDVAIVEFPWTPDDLEQWEDRCYARLNDPHGANIYLLVAEGTIEEDIVRLLDDRSQILGQILDGKSAKEASILGELVALLRGRRKRK